jgi:hypothetical protein
MSQISYFQRYSQRENHATNNTLLMLRYLYQSSPFKLNNVLNSLTENTFSIGMSFEQQIKGAASIPDALMHQDAISIYIETKLADALWDDQIRRHVESIKNAGSAGTQKILLGLTKEPIAIADQDELRAFAKNHGVSFTSITFADVVNALDSECEDYEHDLKSMLEDFKDYLAGEKLLEERNRWLPIFPCGTSFNENIEYGVYYEPPSRPSKRNHRFIGIYQQKAVRAIGEIEAILVHSDGELFYEFGESNSGHLERIKSVIEATSYYDLGGEPNRFYLVPEFLPTDVTKTSSGGIMGMRYLDLRLLLGKEPSDDSPAQDVASALNGKTFE